MANFQGVNSNGQLPPQLTAATRRQNPPSGAPAAAVATAAIEQTGNTLPPVSGAADKVSQPSNEQVQEAVAKLSDFVQNVQRDLSFTVDDSTGLTIITVIDSQTDEVVRQIPSEDLVQLAQNLNELQEALSSAGSAKGNLLEIRV